MSQGAYNPGLEGVAATRSNISFIDGQQGLLEYRGIDIRQLAERSSFLETSYLLVFGKLPGYKELDEFSDAVTTHRRREISYPRHDQMLPRVGTSDGCITNLCGGVGSVFNPISDFDDDYVNGTVVRLLAKFPTLVAAFHQMRQGNDPIEPRDDLDHASNFLYMMTGRLPTYEEARIFDACLILHAEHTVNASTFSTLVTSSTLADPYTAIAAAVGTLSGTLHGGANEKVMAMLKDIGSVENVPSLCGRSVGPARSVLWAWVTVSIALRTPVRRYCRRWWRNYSDILSKASSMKLPLN